MKYWFYSEGNILGPYDPAEMLVLPAFAEDSLVCPETATGDNAGDWRPAAQISEISAALSVGAGRSITAGVMAGAYEYETGFSSAVRYYEDKEPSAGSSYGELLDTIDNVLGAYKEGQDTAPVRPQETDYDLAEKFDIRLSRIQEELEAARWEKNLLLEKMRMKEMEEKKNRERINELEARLKGETGKSDVSARELEQVRHLSDLKEKAETIRKIDEIKREELAMMEEASPKQAEEKAGEPEVEKTIPEVESKTLKSIKRSTEIKLESSLGAVQNEFEPEAGITSRKLKSLGQTSTPAYVYGSQYDKPLVEPEAAPAAAFKPENIEPLPQQAGGVVYDFTVVTSKQPEISQQFKIETRQEEPVRQAPQPAQQAQPAQQPAYEFITPGQRPASVSQHAPAPVQQQPAQASPSFQGFQFQAPSQAQPAAQPAAAEKAPADSPDKTQRIPVASIAGKPEVKQPDNKPRRKGGKLAFLAILVVFGSIAAGGLGYFFMGEGTSFSEFTMLNLGGKKKTAAMPSQLEAKAPAAAAQQQPAATVQLQPAAQVEPQPAPQAAETGKAVSEGTRKALDIVKNYKLSGNRGTIATWFANSFLSGAAGGANEEWTATPLHGDILVVQYRLLRPKQDPMIYQFEVDAAKQDIVRGINNNAIDLLDLSSGGKSASSVTAKKPAPRAKATPRKSSRPKEVPLLPLPDAPSAGPQPEQDPTGFEDAQAEGSDQVKYLKAQESDEELF